MKKQILSEEFRRMQKLAGIPLNEEYNEFLDTEEGGYMREYIDEVADENELDLDYRSDQTLGKMRAMFKELTAEELQDFFYSASGWFRSNASKMSNMDASGIADMLHQVSNLIGQRKVSNLIGQRKGN